MKPLRLELTGFTCFRERTEISFDDLNLFAIAGATGSGKSSLLDAMVYALYGQTPRLGAKGLGVLKNPEAEYLQVVFEFEVGNGIYRVTRTLRAKQEIRVDVQQADASYKQIADVGLKEMGEALVGIVGLDYDSFVRAVLLPQGAFDEFLRGTKSKRIELLIRLLGLSRITDMQREAGQRAKTAKNEISFIDAQLEDTYAETTPDLLREKKRKLESLSQQEKTLAKERDNLQKTLNAQQEIKGILDELTGLREKLAAFKQQEEDTERARQSLKQAEAADSLAPLIGRAEETRTKLEQLTQEKVSLEQTLATKQTRLSALQEASKGAEAAAENIASLNRQVEALAELRPRMAQLSSLGGGLGLASSAVAEVAFSEKAWQLWQTRQAALPNLKRALKDVETSRAALAKLESQLKTNKDVASAGEEALAELTEQGKEASARVEVLEKEATDLEAKLQSAKLADEAAHLRAHLKVGAACPVCEQTVVNLPIAVASRAASLAQALAAQKQILRAAQDERQGFREAYLEARSALNTASERVKDLSARVTEAKTKLADSERRQQELSATFGGQDAGAVEKSLADERQHLLADLARTIAEQTNGRDPVAASDALRKERDALETGVKRAREAEAAARRELDTAQANLNALQKSLLERNVEERSAAETLTKALEASPFSSLQEAKEALLPGARKDALKTKLETYATEKRDAERDEVALVARLGGRSLDVAAFEALVDQQEELGLRLRETSAAKGSTDNAVKEIEKRLEESRALRTKRDGLEKTAGLYEQLSRDLQRNQFPEFLLTRVQEQLAYRASGILRETSEGRYDLRLIDGNYFVLDAWNTGEARDAKTLSGGETFMASLALALALSETIAGNTVLGALFLDEGFGTLDPDTLNSVATVLENLTHEGRMVGLITHVSELTERLPARLQVTKGQGGSTVSWDY